MDGMAGLAGARIGPNAITRVAEALRSQRGEAATQQLFAVAGLSHHLDRPPERMVAEADVIALHAALRQLPGWRLIARDAGQRTAGYLLAHRIPRPVRLLLRLLPARLAAQLLAGAIARHAWTFAGSGRFAVHAGTPLESVRRSWKRLTDSRLLFERLIHAAGDSTGGDQTLVLEIEGCPLARGAEAAAPVCDCYAATFEGVFRALAHRRARVAEIACSATGAPSCRFAVGW